MSLDDATANDETLIDDDLVASLGFEPATKSGAAGANAGVSSATESAQKTDEPLFGSVTTVDDDSVELEGASSSDQKVEDLEVDVEADSGDQASDEIDLVDEADSDDDSIDLTDHADDADSDGSESEEPDSDQAETAVVAADEFEGTESELAAESESVEDSEPEEDTELEADSESVEDTELAELEADSSVETGESTPDGEIFDAELLDANEARKETSAFTDLDDVEPFDFEAEADVDKDTELTSNGQDPDGEAAESDLDELDVPLDLDKIDDLSEGTPVLGDDLAATAAVATTVVTDDLSPADSLDAPGGYLDEVFDTPASPVEPPAPVIIASPVSDVTRKKRPVRMRKLRARKVRRVIRHIDPWSVLTFSVIFHLVFFLSMLLAAIMVWNGAVKAGTVDNIENFIRELGDYETFNINSDVIFRAAVVIAGMMTLASSIIVVLLTVVFNLVSDLVGGIRVTVVEEDTVVVVPPE